MTNLSNSNTSNTTQSNNTLSNSARHNVDPQSFHGMVLDYNQGNAATSPKFRIGNRVLCLSTGEGIKSYVLTADPLEQNDLLAITAHGSHFYFDKKGFSVRTDSEQSHDLAPSLFHDTPANRHAIATLYGIHIEPALTIIDTTDHRCGEAVLIPSFEVLNLTGNISGASGCFQDISLLLNSIQNAHLDLPQVQALASLAQTNTEQWVDILDDQNDRLNEPLARCKFGKTGGGQ